MGYVLDRCPAVRRCCGCVPLRAATLLGAALGLGAAALLALMPTAAGPALGARLGAPAAALARPLRCAVGALGVLLAAAHALLLGAALGRSHALCELYVWAVVALWAPLLGCALAVAVLAVLDERIMFLCGFSLLVVVSISMSVYFTVVVVNYWSTLP